MPENPAATSPGGVTRFIPGLFLFRGYRREWMISDIIAGVSVCIVTIPSVIAYAGLLGMPPQYGLYAALVPLIIYPFFGSSRQIIAGPDITLALLIASAVAPLAAGNADHAVALTCMITILTGALLLLGVKAKVGAVADFLSKPVLVGYMTGAALILMASQLNKLFGVTLKDNEFFPRLYELSTKLGHTHAPTLILGLSLLALLLLLRKFAPKIPPALVICIVANIASYVFKLEERGVAVVGEVPRGLPHFAVPYIDWHDFHSLLPAVIGIALLTYTQDILLARDFAAKNGYEVNGNQELGALGVVDIFTGLFQGFCATGSQARTAISDSAGGKTQLTSLVAAVALAIFLLFLTPIIGRLPIVALASILIYGGWRLVEFDVMKRIYRYYPRSAAIAAVTTLGVLGAGVIPGILIGVVLSLLGLINRISHPPDAVLRELPGHGFHDLGSTEVGQSVPGLLPYRFYAPLLFTNAGYFVERVRFLIASSPTPVSWFLLDAQAITDIDVTAAEALHSLHEELQTKGIALKIAHANRPFRQILERTGLANEIKEDSFFASVHECVSAYESRGDNGQNPLKTTSPAMKNDK